MSLYYVQKFLYEFNRDDRVKAAFTDDPQAAVDQYDLTAEERQALLDADFGKLFHLGVNGQILMHFGAHHGVPWPEYVQCLADGIATHGPVREGVYAVTGYEGIEAHTAALGQRTPAAENEGGS